MQPHSLAAICLGVGLSSACDAPLDRGASTDDLSDEPAALTARALRELAQQAYVKASDTGAWYEFGHSIALSADGSTLAVGGDAGGYIGAVHVFRRRGMTWVQQARIGPPDLEIGDRFGFSVALSGDGSILAVGAVSDEIDEDEIDGAAETTGVVHVFTRRGVTWTREARLAASNADPGDQFGRGVALSRDGSTLAVAATGEASAATDAGGDPADNSVPFAGAVYVFARAGTAWSQQAYLKASSTDAFDDLGTSIALSADGSTLAVGAFAEDSAATGIDGDPADDSASFSGAVYVFARAGTAWSRQAYVKASNTGANDGFGYSVALSADGSTLAVGAPDEDGATTGIDGDQADDSADSAGAAYVFARSGTSWDQQAYVKASNTGAGDLFGASVALSADGSILAVGAEGEDSAATGVGGDQADDAAGLAGAVYTFTRSGTSWDQQAYVKASNTGAGDFFGTRSALSADGSILAVSAMGEDSAATGVDGDQADDSATLAGAVYVFGRRP